MRPAPPAARGAPLSRRATATEGTGHVRRQGPPSWPGTGVPARRYRDIVWAMNDTRTPPAPTSPLFVRLTADEAARLDRAAHELRAPKREIIGALVARYVDPATPRGLDALRAIGVQGRRRPVLVAADDPELAVGRHSFDPVEPPEVLTSDQLAALLQVDIGDAEALLEAGEIPARRIAGRWRVARQAVLDWLSGAASS